MTELRPDLESIRRKDGSMIAKLLKCLYGLKQSPRKWFNRIRELLLALGLKVSEHDTCLFYLVVNGKRNYLLLFVDDMLVAFQDKSLQNKLFESLVQSFGEISSQSGSVISFLGITITQTEEYISKQTEANRSWVTEKSDRTGFVYTGIVLRFKESFNLLIKPSWSSEMYSSVCVMVIPRNEITDPD